MSVKQQILSLYKQGESPSEIFHRLGTARSYVRRVIKAAGFAAQKPKLKVPQDVLEQLYGLGLGVLAISKETGLSSQRVLRRLSRAGILDRTRVFKKKYDSQLSRRRDRSPYEFTSTVKQEAFQREHYICQECQQLIEGNWRQATYHHIKSIATWHTKLPVEFLRSLENCMVLHSACHNDRKIFQKLHGFDIAHITTKLPHREFGECMVCGAPACWNGVLCRLCREFVNNTICVARTCRQCGSSYPRPIGKHHLCWRCYRPQILSDKRNYTAKELCVLHGIKESMMKFILYPFSYRNTHGMKVQEFNHK